MRPSKCRWRAKCCVLNNKLESMLIFDVMTNGSYCLDSLARGNQGKDVVVSVHGRVYRRSMERVATMSRPSSPRSPLSSTWPFLTGASTSTVWH